MNEKVQIFITHYVTKDLIELNDMLVEAVTFLEMDGITDYPHETIVIYYDENDAGNELYDRIPKVSRSGKFGSGVKIIKNDRPGYPSSVPSMRNKILDIATEGGYFVILQNDIRVSAGWLTCLVRDMKRAEVVFKDRGIIMSIRMVPYHYIPNIITPSYPKFWEYLQNHPSCLSIDKMDSWCKNWRFKFKNGMLYSEGNEPFTDDGHQLMMFISRKEVFVGGNGVGLCDEKFLGWGYDDSDWGIRALMLGKKNLKSQNSLIGHLQDFTCSQPKYKIMPCDNRKVFIDKYGQDTFNEMQTGQLWLRLHREFK